MRKLLPLIMIILFNCSADKNPISFLPHQSEHPYFPLSVGNNWTFDREYADVNPWMERLIQKKIEINDQTYFIVKNTLGIQNENPYIETDTLRIDNEEKVWQYENGEEYLWLDFSLNHGDNYQYGEFTVSVTEMDAIQVPAGEFRNCIRFFFDIPMAADEEVCYTYAENVGLIKCTVGEGPTLVLSDYTL